MSNRWPAATRERPCVACGAVNRCKNAPDGTAAVCWRSGGKVIQLNGNGTHHDNGNGTGYVGKAHGKGKPKGKGFDSPALAVIAAAKMIGDGATVTLTHEYLNRGGEHVASVARIETTDAKDYRPVHLKKERWHVGDPSGKWPLYRLPKILNQPMVLVVEGEKCADAAESVNMPATTSAHGASSAGKTDWTPLAGKLVPIFPDNDEAGEGYARDVARILAKLNPPAQVKMVRLEGLSEGGDLADWLDHRSDEVEPEALQRQLCDLIEAAPVIEPSAIIGGPVLVNMADVERREVQWLWNGRIPLGRITLLVGMPGCGKSFFTIDAASRVTTGSPWPDDSPCPFGSVILVSAEDDPHDTIGPRLDAHYADSSKVRLLAAVTRIGEDGARTEMMFTLADVAALEMALKQTPDCKLIIVDPIGSFLGGDTDAHRDNEVRGVLAPVARLAEKYGPAVVVVAHRRKSAGNVADDLALGSRAFTGIARAVWHLSRDEDNKSRRLLLPGKNNLAPEGYGFAFTIGGDPPRLAWERAPVEMNADDALAIENAADHDDKRGPEPVKQNAAKEWLQTRLRGGPALVGDVKKPEAGTLRADVKEAGLSWSTIRRASEDLGVISERCSWTGKYQWRLLNEVAQVPLDTNNLSNLSNQSIPEEKEGISERVAIACSSSSLLGNQSANDESEVQV